LFVSKKTHFADGGLTVLQSRVLTPRWSFL